MPLQLQIVIGIVLALFFIYIINIIRKNKLDIRYALPWFAILVLILILDLFPDLMHWITELTGAQLPINMLIFLGFFLVLAIIFSLTVTISSMTHKMKNLAQEVGLLKKEIEELKKKDTESR